jgi:hypothetical protein
VNYEANEIDWQRGDVVLLDSDAKSPRCVALVLGERGNCYYGVYPFITETCNGKPHKWSAPKKYCHSVKRFPDVTKPDSLWVSQQLLLRYSRAAILSKDDEDALRFVSEVLEDFSAAPLADVARL